MPVTELARLTKSHAACIRAVCADGVLPADGRAAVELGAKIERLGNAVRLAGVSATVAGGTWEGEGDRSAASWVASTTGTSMSDAIGTVATAQQLTELPEVAAAVREG